MFQNLFDKHSQKYAKFRPSYPDELFEFIVAQAKSKDLAWDCGTGSGQAAVALSPYFRQVVATDASSAQLEHAQLRENIDYRLAPSEKSTLEDATVDLITAANAVHWFDLAAFYAEAQRVMRPGAVIAVWCYSGINTKTDHVEAALKELSSSVSNYWPAPIELVKEHYLTLPFPFKDLAAPKFSLKVEWTIDQLIGYTSTWSAREAYLADKGIDPIDQWARRHEDLLRDHVSTYIFEFPLHLRIGTRKQSV